jgi:hypothetical protein
MMMFVSSFGTVPMVDLKLEAVSSQPREGVRFGDFLRDKPLARLLLRR